MKFCAGTDSGGGLGELVARPHPCRETGPGRNQRRRLVRMGHARTASGRKGDESVVEGQGGEGLPVRRLGV
jgi:hypothetical protein